MPKWRSCKNCSISAHQPARRNTKLLNSLSTLSAAGGCIGTLFDTDADIDDPATAVIEQPLDEAALRSSIGGSIIWNSPLGPLRADFAHVLTKEDEDRTTWFRFGGNSRF